MDATAPGPTLLPLKALFVHHMNANRFLCPITPLAQL